MFCSRCGKKAIEGSDFCSSCGNRLSEETPVSSDIKPDKIREINGISVNIDEIIRTHGRNNVAMADELKKKTGISDKEANRIAGIAFRNRGIKPLDFFEARAAKADLDRPKEIEKLELEQLRQEAKDSKKAARCPRCKSTSLSAHKKGFGIGKAVVGTAIAGPLGLVAGNLGSKKIRVTCMKCGKQFWA